MESAIRLHCCPLLSPPSLRLSYGSRGSEDARGSILRLRFNHATLCLSHFNNTTNHPVARSFRHANCTLNSFISLPSKNEGSSSDNKILRRVTGVSLVLACILGLFNFSSKMSPKFNTAYAFPAMSGGEPALGSLLQMSNSEAAEHSGHKAPVDDVKEHAIRLSKSGNKREAIIKILKKEYDDNAKDESERTRNLQTALVVVELLIVQGNYEEARKLLDQQIDQRRKHPEQDKYEDKIKELLESYENEEPLFEKFSIARILLYKAIAHTMLEDKEATKWWAAFTKTLSGNE